MTFLCGNEARDVVGSRHRRHVFGDEDEELWRSLEQVSRWESQGEAGSAEGAGCRRRWPSWGCQETAWSQQAREALCYPPRALFCLWCHFADFSILD